MELPELESANGSPAWMATFADLMSLLLCFFVLLFAFSQIDAVKFKQIAGSMKEAFGVQRDVVASEIPMGTSAVFDEFSPGKVEPTPFDEVKQHAQQTAPQLATNPITAQDPVEQGKESNFKKVLEKLLENYLEQGLLEMEDLGQQLVIRIKENGAFPAGSAHLQPQFKPILLAIADALADVPGKINVSGHTDDLKVNNELFRNNWQLSAERAVAVAVALEQSSLLSSDRLQVMAFADKKPLVPNNSAQNRKVNRRVEIAIEQGSATETENISIIE